MTDLQNDEVVIPGAYGPLIRLALESLPHTSVIVAI